MHAPSLRELQESFWRSLAREPGRADGGALDPALVELIPPTPTLAPAARLQIYADMYFWRIRDALREDFPRLAAVLGGEGFEALVRGYLAAHPSVHPSLRHAGRHLVAYAAAQVPAGAPPFLADLARLEWTRVEVFDAPDAAALGLAELHRIPAEEWPDLRFAPVPALAVVTAAWPVNRIWQAAGEDGALPAFAPERTALRVWREGFTVFHARMDPAEETALGRLVAGADFATICDAFENAEDAGAQLLRWLEDGIVAEIL